VIPGRVITKTRLTTGSFAARIAALVPPPRTHRHRYFGVLAPPSSTPDPDFTRFRSPDLNKIKHLQLMF
jgi:hypothetical protein